MKCPELLLYWGIRHNLYVVDGVVLVKNQVLIPPQIRNSVAQASLHGSSPRIVIPPNLRKEVSQSLHSAHQGVTGMNERAKAGVYLPGITTDIQYARDSCTGCNKTMPSQARTPPIEPRIPTTPFEAIACDFFHFKGHYYFVAADRLSGWLELQQDRTESECMSNWLLSILEAVFTSLSISLSTEQRSEQNQNVYQLHYQQNDQFVNQLLLLLLNWYCCYCIISITCNYR